MAGPVTEVCEVTVIISEPYEQRLEEAVAKLQAAGLHVLGVDKDNAVVRGDVEIGQLRQVRKLACVAYVRTVFTYLADPAPADSGNTAASSA